ncbi:MAG: rhodanese-like domain-containing protein [Flavobacteriia bacterium]|nr:MAG: rhodanese-like domain-containing protein [Flavobacteriia bacterium]
MKTLSFKIAMLFFLSINFTSCAQSAAVEKNNVVSLISPQELKAKLGDDILLIDIRTPQEFAQGHISGAKLINFFDPDFMQQMSKLDRSKELYIYCRSGHRSGKATENLKTVGFPKIHDLKGGINNWYQNNMKIVK